MTVDLSIAYMLMLILMTLTLVQGHSGTEKAKKQRWIISTTEQAISIKLAATVDHFVRDLDFANVYMIDQLVYTYFKSGIETPDRNNQRYLHLLTIFTMFLRAQ